MRTDYLLNEDFDLADDLTAPMGESDQQHVELILLIQKGELRQTPGLGFGIRSRENSVWNPIKFKRDLKVELGSDDYDKADVIVGNTPGDFTITI